ncbi:MAG: excinuclease ABC subunit UvrC [Bacillota bacterium]|nr:excinuclease ABC subunit UvrC [Bacillota bacterium]
MALDDTLAVLPTSPGVYLMKDADGEVIYVGKAINLRNRVRSYFQTSSDHSPKVVMMVEHIADLDYIVTASELEALILECNLIKKYRPRYNVRLRDDKTYPFIKVTTGEPYPGVYLTRRVVCDGSRYFGPYTDVSATRETLRLLKRVFPLRQCSKKIDPDSPAPRPCLNYQIKRCLGPCAGQIDVEAYGEVVDEVVMFLEGRQDDLARSLKRRMVAAADALNYEQAAVFRDQLQAVETVVQKQRIVSESGADQDVIAIARDQWGACAQILFVRGGKLVGNDHFMLGGTDGADDAETLSSLVKEYYSQAEAGSLPREVLLESEIEDADIVAAWLSDLRGRAVSVKTPKRGEKRGLVELASANAAEFLERKRAAEQREARARMDALAELSIHLRLSKSPSRIECYDISTLQGTEAVGSMVVFEAGLPAKSQYRRFRIRQVEGQDDYAMMAEVIRRRLVRAIGDDPDPKFARLPDLIVVDGGRGQLNAAADVLDSLGRGDIPLISLAEREEEIYLREQPDPLILPRDSAALHMIQYIRDEAHRYALAYHRNLRGKRSISSELTDLPGIGKKRTVALMKEFGSLEALTDATVDEIAATPGMNRVVAMTVYEHLHPDRRVDG